MTNFAFIMDLLGITAKEFLAYGFDHTLISRWRSGKRRLMPGRWQVAVIAGFFLQTDSQRDYPVLSRLLEIWCPAVICKADSEKKALLEIFLTENGQTDPDYLKKRAVRLHCLQHHDSDTHPTPQGIEAVRLGLLDFLDLIANHAEPLHFHFVFTEGLSVYLDDADFGSQFIDKLLKLFKAGHRMHTTMHSDTAMCEAWHFQKIKLYVNLEGYVSTQYYSDYIRQGNEKILAVAGDKYALRVTRDSFSDANSARINLYHDADSLAGIVDDMQKYITHARPQAYYGYFTKPNGWFVSTDIAKDRPCYLFTRLPHLGVVPPEDLAERFTLGDDELALLQREFHPLTLEPGYFNDDIPVRHIFCESDIEDALSKKRHLSYELSIMLGRKVWMPRHHLNQQLARILSMLKTRRNYEVCFLDSSHFNDLKLQIGVWGNEAAISWIPNRPALSCKNYLLVSCFQNHCVTTWNDIPAETRDPSAAIRKITQWIND